MNKQYFIQLIDKYIRGTASMPEENLVEEYLKRMEADGITHLPEAEEMRLKQAMWSKIQQRTGNHQAKVVKVSWHQKRGVRFAAALAAACVIFVVFIWRPWESAMEYGSFKTVTVAQGESIQKVKLADGSLIWIKPNSTLSFPEAFTGNLREINLKGEALFEIAKDAQHPFIVHSSNLNVKVLGTSFNIKDAVEKDTVEVAVLTGKVWVNPLDKSASDSIVLQPFHKLLMNKKAGTVQKGEFTSTESYIAGTEYNMNFNNTPLDSINKRIEGKFNVVVKVNVPNGNECRVSGDFTDQSLEHTIDVICKTIGASYKQNQDTIYISGLKCK